MDNKYSTPGGGPKTGPQSVNTNTNRFKTPSASGAAYAAAFASTNANANAAAAGTVNRAAIRPSAAQQARQQQQQQQQHSTPSNSNSAASAAAASLSTPNASAKPVTAAAPTPAAAATPFAVPPPFVMPKRVDSGAATEVAASPISAGPVDGAAFPEFQRLLTDLSTRRLVDVDRSTLDSSSTGTGTGSGTGSGGLWLNRESTAAAYERALTELAAERTAYYQTQIVFNELRDLINEHTAPDSGNSNSSAASSNNHSNSFMTAQKKAAATGAAAATSVQQHAYTSLAELIAVAEAAQSLPLVEADGTIQPPALNAAAASERHRYGLTESDLYAASAAGRDPHTRAQSLRAIHQIVVPHLNARLKEKCELLADFHDPILPASGSDQKSVTSPLASASKRVPLPASELYASVDRMQRETVSRRAELQDLNRTIDTQLVACYQSETELLLRVLDVITNLKLKHQFKFDEFRKDYLRDRLHALRARLSLLRYQLLERTYTAPNVAALQRTKQHLDSAERELAQTHRQITDQLNDYKRAGLGFDDLVREYTDVLAAIKHAQWQAAQIEQTHN